MSLAAVVARSAIPGAAHGDPSMDVPVEPGRCLFSCSLAVAVVVPGGVPRRQSSPPQQLCRSGGASRQAGAVRGVLFTLSGAGSIPAGGLGRKAVAHRVVMRLSLT